MLTWLAATLTGPAVLIGSAFPGFGSIPDGVPLPAVDAAIERAHVAPYTGGRVAFNDPTGPQREQYALVTRLNEGIRSARPGSTVRLAAYSFAMSSTARALLAAHRHGAHVQVVVDDHSAGWGPVRMLRKELGEDTGAESFVKVCDRSCRGGRGVQHAKFVTVSSGTQGDGLVLVGSLNLTGFSSQRQWNDLYSVTDPAVHDQLVRIFDRMVRDRRQRRLTLPVTRSGFHTDVSPYAGPGGDPIRARLRDVRCHAAASGTGRGGRTLVRIAMHAWNGERGVVLAREVARLGREGCDVKVLYGVGMGRRVARVLRAAGVPTRDSANGGRRVHQKVMLLSGAIGEQRDAEFVWTGSHNWSDRSTRNDEVMLRIAGRPLVDAYLANFSRMWRVAGSG